MLIHVNIYSGVGYDTLDFGLRNYALLVDNLPIVDYSTDPADNPILATALKRQCNFLVRGDKKDLLSLKIVEGVSIITARTALEIISH